MSNIFTTDQLAKSETLDPNFINRLYKLISLCKFMEINSKEARLTKKTNFKSMGIL